MNARWKADFEMHMEIKLPALLTLQSGINQPRYPSLSKMLRANRHPLDTILSGSLESPIHTSVHHADNASAEKRVQD